MKGKRVVITGASRGIGLEAAIALADRMGERRWSGMDAYGQSKLANILFSAELARQLTERGVTHVTSNSLHPGTIGSNFMLENKGVLAALWKLGKPFFKTPK